MRGDAQGIACSKPAYAGNHLGRDGNRRHILKEDKQSPSAIDAPLGLENKVADRLISEADLKRALPGIVDLATK